MAFNWLKQRAFKWAAKSLNYDDLEHFFLNLSSQYSNGSISNAQNIWGTLTPAQQESIYRNHPIVFACIWRISIAFLESRAVVGHETEKGFEELPDHHLLNLMRKPNEWLSLFEFWSYQISHLTQTGKGFVWILRNGLQDANGVGEASELWPIPSSWVKVVPLQKILQGDKRRIISHYEVNPEGYAGEPILVSPNDMIYSRYVNPSNFHDGSGPMQAAYHDYKTDVEREDYLVEMLDNSHTPGMILKQKLDWSEEQMEMMRKTLKDHLGHGKRGSPLLISGEDVGVDYPIPLKDMDFPGMSEQVESRICAAFGVPPILISSRVGLKHATYSNYDVAERSFYRGTMTGIWLAMSSSFTRTLASGEGDDETEIRFDSSKVRALQEDQTEMATRATELHAGGVATFQEAREMAGLSIDPEAPDYTLQRMGFERIPVNAEPEPTPDESDGLSGGDEWEEPPVEGDEEEMEEEE